MHNPQMHLVEAGCLLVFLVEGEEGTSKKRRENKNKNQPNKSKNVVCGVSYVCNFEGAGT